MKKKAAVAVLFLSACVLSFAANPSLPKVIDIQSGSAPEIEVFRANDRTVRFTAKDDGSAYSLAGSTVSAAWFVSDEATGVAQATVALVDGGSNGVFDATWNATNLNYAAGKYLYAVKVVDSNSAVVTWQQGRFIIKRSPFTTGPTSVTFTDTVNWALVSDFLNPDLAPVLPGVGITSTTSSAGRVTFNAPNTNDSAFTNTVNVSGDAGLTLTGGPTSGNNTIGLTVASLDAAGMTTDAELLAAAIAGTQHVEEVVAQIYPTNSVTIEFTKTNEFPAITMGGELIDGLTNLLLSADIDDFDEAVAGIIATSAVPASALVDLSNNLTSAYGAADIVVATTSSNYTYVVGASTGTASSNYTDSVGILTGTASSNYTDTAGLNVGTSSSNYTDAVDLVASNYNESIFVQLYPTNSLTTTYSNTVEYLNGVIIGGVLITNVSTNAMSALSNNLITVIGATGAASTNYTDAEINGNFLASYTNNGTSFLVEQFFAAGVTIEDATGNKSDPLTFWDDSDNAVLQAYGNGANPYLALTNSGSGDLPYLENYAGFKSPVSPAEDNWMVNYQHLTNAMSDVATTTNENVFEVDQYVAGTLRLTNSSGDLLTKGVEWTLGSFIREFTDEVLFIDGQSGVSLGINNSVYMWMTAAKTITYAPLTVTSGATTARYLKADDSQPWRMEYVADVDDELVNHQSMTNAVFSARAQATLPVDAAQTFSAAAGFELLTNFSAQTKGAVTFATNTYTVGKLADWKLSFGASLESSQNSNTIETHAFTNGVEIPAVGYKRSIGVSGSTQFGVTWFEYIFFDLPSGTDIDFRVDVSQNSTLTANHFNAILEEMK